MRTATEDRLMAKRLITEGGCWVWTGNRDRYGYGQIGMTPAPRVTKMRSVHRVSYETFVGPIPEGLVIDHLCRTRACFNPDHMEPVTALENHRRGLHGSLSPSVCRNGHDKTPDVDCRTCVDEWFIVHREERRAYQRAYYALGPAERQRRKDAGLPVVTTAELAAQQEQGAVA